jgi:hypothetical protein
MQNAEKVSVLYPRASTLHLLSLKAKESYFILEFLDCLFDQSENNISVAVDRKAKIISVSSDSGKLHASQSIHITELTYSKAPILGIVSLILEKLNKKLSLEN